MAKSSKAPKAKSMPPAKPGFRKTSPELIALFDLTMGSFPDVQVRKVFGYPCGFVNGYMTVGLHEDDFFIRLPNEDQEQLLSYPGTRYLEVMKGRPMKDYVVLSKKILDSMDEVRSMVEKAIKSAANLPPKK